MSLYVLQKAIIDWKLNTKRPFSSFGTKEIECGAIEGLINGSLDLEVATVAL